jgi:uncharacterized glyoxalase superfamily protein PhnB
MNRQIFALTLATRDLAATEDFYAKVFDAEVIYSDEVCRIFKFGETLINCLSIENARELFAPAVLSGTGHASMLTIQVESVDAEAERLRTLGVALNTEPTDQPWGIRTITFQDPAGQLWEFSHPL